MRPAPTILALAGPLLLAGCLVAEEKVELTPDGGGTLRQVWTTDLEAWSGLYALLAMLAPDMVDPGEAAADLPDALHPGWFVADAAAAKGHRIVAATYEVTGERRATTLEARFDTLAAAARAGAFPGSTVALALTAEGRWRLSFRTPLRKSSDLTTDRTGGIDLASVLPMLEDHLKGLRLERSLVLPAKVLATNGTLAEDGRTVSWSLDFAAIVAGKAEEHFAEFEAAEGLKLEPFVHQPDPARLLPRLTEKPPPLVPAPSAPGGEPAPAAPAEGPAAEPPPQEPGEGGG
jgi:hypothetical protein